MKSKAYALALVFFGFFAFFNAIPHPFVHDDVIFILKDPHILELNHWVDVFRISAASQGVNTYYRPVLEIIYRLEYHLFGPNPWGFHLFNICVHILNGLLLFALLQRLFFPKEIAWVVSLFFLIHPVQTEAVSCIAGISNLWMALAVFLALHAYLSRWYSISGLMFAISMLSKEQGIMFIPLIIVLDLSQNRKQWRSWFFFALIAVALLALRQGMTGSSLLRDIMASPGELYLRLAAIPRDLGMYLRLIVCPYDLHYYRSTDILQPNLLAWSWAVVSAAGLFYCYQKYVPARSTMILGIGWFLAALLPVLNITPLINEYSFILTSEHFLYLPIIGILILIATTADHFIKLYRRSFFGIALASCLLLTWYQNSFWRSEIALFERMLAYEPNFGRGHLLLAKADYFHGRFKEADLHYAKAYKIMTGYAMIATNLTAKRYYLKIIKDILMDWAQNDLALGRKDSAIVKFKEAIPLP